MMQVELIPAFEDNYIWLISQPGSQNCAVVDPGDEEPVLESLQQHGLLLSAILITHKHYDHVGGIDGLKKRFPQASVYGPGNENIRQVEIPLAEGACVELPGLSLSFQVMDVPGHTEGHIAYYGENALFCGDTLFAGGCGRVFSGTFEQLSASLLRISKLPAETQLFCAHEYTQANLGFAEWVEPGNLVLQQRIEEVAKMRAKGEPTVPSMLETEIETNPFLRVSNKNVICAAEKWAGHKLNNDAEVFKALRQWKDKEYD